MSNLAVAANPPVPTGLAPAPAGASSPTVAPADAAGGRDQVFSFPVTIYATATITGEIKDEARNTIGCDLRDALAEESSVDLDNGGRITFERCEIGATPLTFMASPTERWHATPQYVSLQRSVTTGRSIIRDENGLFVAECVTADAPVIAEAPTMVEALRDAQVMLRDLEAPAHHADAADLDERISAILARIGGKA